MTVNDLIAALQEQTERGFGSREVKFCSRYDFSEIVGDVIGPARDARYSIDNDPAVFLYGER